MRRVLILLLLLATFCLGAAFSYHNPQAVELNYLAGSVELGLGLLLIIAAGVGLLLALLAGGLLSLKLRAERMRLRRRLNKAENELASLRKIPLKDG